ncbi:uncharacterized protein B0H64DRAFT_180077 [Chaetomium fimeti]|uniref:Uncharacterized protein n=1 Tax=Chaetomium fimeti TaxID=1854472 RepID=A0AAE0HCN2_9PEZI|nr:hypothetical protein B0H64DRAFT_180077 [Chaetomium fimeti]
MHLAYPFEDAAATTSHDAPVLSPENGAGGSAPQDTLRYYVTAAVNTTLVTQCAQELFSLFIFAIAANITKVGGKTTKAPLQSGSVRVWDNTLLTAIAQQAVEAKLAPTLEKALALVIPAFARHNLVPVTPPLEAQEEAKMGTRRRWVSSRYSNSKCEEEIILMECSRRG